MQQVRFAKKCFQGSVIMKEITIQIPDRFSKVISLTCIGETSKFAVDITAITAHIKDGDTIIINEDGTFEIADSDLENKNDNAESEDK